MNGKGKTIKLSVMLILMIALMFSTAFMMIIKATEDTDKEKEAKFDGDYTIEYLIRHFNLVTFKDVSRVEHIVGPVLIGGEVKDKLYHSQETGNISSYIKGKIAPKGNVSPRDNNKPTLYLGTKSGATILENGGANVADEWYTSNPTVLTDDYLDFDILFNQIKNQSKSLVSGKEVTKNEKNEIEVQMGDAVIIENLEDVSGIRLIGEEDSNKLTLINITTKGSVSLPQLWINDSQAKSGESDQNGTAIVWNLPNATAIKMADSASVGHIIAPSADIEAPETNFAGCMIANSLDGHIEGHFYAYRGIALPLKEIPKEEPKDKNNTTQNNTTKPSNNTTGNNTTASKNNTTKPKNNTTGNNTMASKNNTTKPKNNTTGNSTTASKNNTTKPKNNTTGNSTTASKNNTTKNNVAVANKTNKTNTSKNEDGMVLGAEWEKNNTSKNKTDKTTADGKLPQTGDEFSQKIVLGVVMIALVVVFGVKYVKHKNELDANK